VPHIADLERVAVGRRPDDARATRHAAGGADVLDDDRLAEELAHALRLDAGGRIDARRRPGTGTTRVRGRVGKSCALAAPGNAGTPISAPVNAPINVAVTILLVIVALSWPAHIVSVNPRWLRSP